MVNLLKQIQHSKSEIIKTDINTIVYSVEGHDLGIIHVYPESDSIVIYRSIECNHIFEDVGDYLLENIQIIA